MQQFLIVEVDPQGVDAQLLLREAAIEARALYPELSGPNKSWPRNTPTLEGGFYLIGYEGVHAVACGAIRPLGDNEAEIRRIFVTRSARRRGLARAMLTDIEVRAKSIGHLVLKLETGYKQLPAIALYESQSYDRIAPFGEYANDPTSVCFKKHIGSTNGED